jgi:hypothetical protein
VLQLRKGDDKDHDFVRSSWIIHLDKIKPRGLENHLCRLSAHRLMDTLLSVSEIVIAVDPEEPDLYAGCAVYQDYRGVRYLHWAYTKKPLRKMGVQRHITRGWPTTTVTTLCPEKWQIEALQRRFWRPSAQAQYLFAIAQIERGQIE